MSAAPARPPDRLVKPPRPLAYLLLRLLLAGGLLAAGFAGLTFVADAERASGRRLQFSEDAPAAALQVGIAAAVPGLFLLLLAEGAAHGLTRAGLRWSRAQWLLPLLLAAAVAGLAAYVFHVSQMTTPGKGRVVILAGGLLGYLAVSLYLACWQLSHLGEENQQDFPFTWYAVLMAATAAFMGAQRAWTDLRPLYREVLLYREHKWVEEGKPVRPPPGAPLPEREGTL